MKVPKWIRHHFPHPETLEKTQSLLRRLSLHTVCEEAKCPNIGKCFGKGTATFLILGDICTRSCKFCAVKKGIPHPVDPNEPKRIALAIQKLGLSHAVITSVTRDDLQDHGASQFISTITEIRKINNIPKLNQNFGPKKNNLRQSIELLLPILDFKALEKIVATNPEVINHNVETVPRLYPKIRPGFRYYNSLKLLAQVKKINPSIITKSGFMLGLGETQLEVIKMMKDLVSQKVDILTIGQYLRPSGKHYPVAEYIHPKKFLEYKKIGYELGFRFVVAGPYVRSSYRAHDALIRCTL